MRKIFVNTGNALRFLDGLAALDERGASEACLLVVSGAPGLGKTETAAWWAARQDAVFLRAKSGWTATWILADLLAALGATPAGSKQRMHRQVLDGLAARAGEAQRAGRGFAVVVDEIEHIVRKREELELLRDVSDLLEIPVVLVGMEGVREQLTRFRQVSSRIARTVAFTRNDAADTARLVAELCEVEVREDLVRFLHEAAGGFTRETKEAIRTIERFGRLNPGPVGRAEMAGKPLLCDRRTGKDILVTP